MSGGWDQIVALEREVARLREKDAAQSKRIAEQRTQLKSLYETKEHGNAKARKKIEELQAMVGKRELKIERQRASIEALIRSLREYTGDETAEPFVELPNEAST